MNIITLLNNKGGVGKSTITVHLGALFAEMGFKTLIMDGDPQGHATLYTNSKKEAGLYGLLAEDKAWSDVLRPINPDWYTAEPVEKTNLMLLPGNAQTSNLLSFQDSPASQLPKRLRELDGFIDFVFVDTSPSVSALHTAFYMASDFVIFPTLCTRLSVDGLSMSLKHLQKAQKVAGERGLPIAQALGVIPTQYRSKELVDNQTMSWIDGRYGESLRIFTPIRRSTEWKKSESLRLPAHRRDGRTIAAIDAIQMANEVMDELHVKA